MLQKLNPTTRYPYRTTIEAPVARIPSFQTLIFRQIPSNITCPYCAYTPKIQEHLITYLKAKRLRYSIRPLTQKPEHHITLAIVNTTRVSNRMFDNYIRDIIGERLITSTITRRRDNSLICIIGEKNATPIRHSLQQNLEDTK